MLLIISISINALTVVVILGARMIADAIKNKK